MTDLEARLLAVTNVLLIPACMSLLAYAFVGCATGHAFMLLVGRRSVPLYSGIPALLLVVAELSAALLIFMVVRDTLKNGLFAENPFYSRIGKVSAGSLCLAITSNFFSSSSHGLFDTGYGFLPNGSYFLPYYQKLIKYLPSASSIAEALLFTGIIAYLSFRYCDASRRNINIVQRLGFLCGCLIFVVLSITVLWTYEYLKSLAQGSYTAHWRGIVGESVDAVIDPLKFDSLLAGYIILFCDVAVVFSFMFLFWWYNHFRLFSVSEAS